MADIVAKPFPFLSDAGRPAIPWSECHRLFETYLTALEWEKFLPQRKAAVLKTFLGADANQIAHVIESTRLTGVPAVNEYDYLVEGLAAHFDGAASQRINRIQFPRLWQEDTESVIKLARRVEYVGRQCKFGSEEASSINSS